MSWKEARETSPEFDSEAPHVDPAPLAPEGAEQERASKKTRASMTSMASQVLLLYFYTATAKDFFNLTDLLLPVEAFRLGLTGYLTAQVLIGGITAAVPSLGIHLLGRVKSFERPSWWGRLVWVSFLVGFLIFGILSYRAAMNSLGRVEIEVAEIRWDGKTNEFVVKAYLDKIVARAIQEGIMSGELSVQAYGIDGDSFATKHTFGSYSFPGSHGPWKSPPMPRPSRSVLTETIRLHASARSEGYKEFLPSRVALRFVTSRGEALGEYVELHNTSRITLWSREDGKLRVSRRTK